MPNPDTFHTYLKNYFVTDFLSDPKNKEMAALAKDRKRIAKQIRDMHLSHLTDGVSTDAFSEEEKTILEQKQKELLEKDNKFWDTIKNEALAYFSQKPCSAEQLSMQMNHGEEMHDAEMQRYISMGKNAETYAKTNWTLKSPYSPKQQYERSKVRNDLSKKVIAEQIDRLRSAEQQNRLGGQMRLNSLGKDDYCLGAAYSTAPGKPDPDKARALESFSCVTAKGLSEGERDAYIREFYGVFRNTFNQIKEKNIDLNKFSDMTQWKNPDGTWNDKMLVENYETISLLNKISAASASMNERASFAIIPPDEECERFCCEHDLQLSLSTALMDRLSYIQNPYYDEIDLDDPQMKQTFSPVLSSPTAQAFKNRDVETLTEEEIGIIDRESETYKYYIREKVEQFNKLNPSSVSNTMNITDIFSSWTHSQYQGFKHNLRALANAMRAQGSDLSQLMMCTDYQYRQAQLEHEKALKTLHELREKGEKLTRDERDKLQDLEARKVEDETLWKQKAGATLKNLSVDTNDLTRDPIVSPYWQVMNTPSKYVTFTSRDGKAKEMKIPVSVIMNPNFAKDLNLRLGKEKSAPPKEPENGANAAEKEKYEYEKALYDIEDIYRSAQAKNIVSQEKQAEPVPLPLAEIQKGREARVAQIIQANSHGGTFTDDRDPDERKEYSFPPLSEESLRQAVYADEVEHVKRNGRAYGKVSPEAAEEAIKKARLTIIDAVNLSNKEREVGEEPLTVESFIKTHGEQSIIQAKTITADYQRRHAEITQKAQYADLFNITEAQFDELWAANEKLAKSKRNLHETFGDLCISLAAIKDQKAEKIPYYLEGLDDLHNRIEKGGTLFPDEEKLRPLWENVAQYAQKEAANIPFSDEEQADYSKAKEEYDKACEAEYRANGFLRHLSKIAKAQERPTLQIIDEIEMDLAKQAGKEYHLTEDEIETSYQEAKKANRLTTRLRQIRRWELNIQNWESEQGLKSGYIKELLAKDPNLRIDSAKAMVVNSKNMSAIKNYAKKLGVSADTMLKSLEARQKEFPLCTAKFFYEDTRQSLDTAFKTFGMTQKEFFKYCQETNNDPISLAEKVSANDMPLAFDITAEEYGMSSKEFLKYCQETNKDPFVLAQRTAAESRGEYNVLENEDALLAEGEKRTAEAEALENRIKNSSVKDFSGEMVTSLKNLAIAADSDAKSLRSGVEKDSLTDTILTSGKRYYGDVVTELQTKAKKGETMSSSIKKLPLYMLAAHELLKEQLKSSERKDTGIADFLGCYKGKDKAKGLEKMLYTMSTIPEISEPLNNMSAYDLQLSLNDGTFMKNLDHDAVQKLNNTLQEEAQLLSAGKQMNNEIQVSKKNVKAI